jgi:hypothetical protein
MKWKLSIVILIVFIFLSGCMAPTAPMRGIQGANGTPGSSTIDVNYTFTGAPGTAATVTNIGNATVALLDFFIPEGVNGTPGIQGINGTPGEQGTQGVPGNDGATGATGATGPMGPMNQTPNMTPGENGATGGTGGTIFYFNNTVSDISGYESIEQIPSGAAEVVESVSVTATGGDGLIDPYVTLSGYPGVASLPAGLWRFRTFHNVSSNAGVSNVVFSVYNRTATGTETLLFTTVSDEINQEGIADEYLTSYVQNAPYTVSLTDRIVIKVYGRTTRVPATTVRFVYQGTIRTSHVQSPLAIEDASSLTFSVIAGEQLYKGEPVYISGASGTIPVVNPANNTDTAKSRVVGLMVENAAAGVLTTVRRAGTLTEVDTRSTNININPLAQTWAAGDLLFSCCGGGLSNIRPTSGRSVKAAYTLTNSDADGVLMAYPMENPVWATSASNEGIVLRLGDDDGITNVSIRDYANNQVGYIDSNGAASFTSVSGFDATGIYWQNATRALTGTTIFRDVNDDYTRVTGGDRTTPYGASLTLYGGGNGAQTGGLILSIGNASGGSSEVVFSALGRTDTPTLDLNNNNIISLATPTNDYDAATKKYVDDTIGTGLAGTKVYYVSDTSGGETTRKLTFINGLLVSET